ncbi:MAG: polysaccharide deacetylase [Solirubrobacterales bacterium]|nr:polysaccharide deacetylase [Solirubrobacterales bacterium]
MSDGKKQLSVLIATHNRRSLLQRCLEALAQQSLDPASFEVIVADDGSSDGTAAMVEALESPLQLRVLHLEKVGKSAALNAAIEIAQAGVCLFLDDDIVASPQLAAEHLAAHRGDPSAFGIGALSQQPPDARDWYAHAYAIAWNQRYDELAGRRLDWTDCYGGNVSAPRSTLVAIGGFSTELAAVEDLDLGFRLWRAGCRPVYLPRARGLHDDQKLRHRIIADTRRYGGLCAEFSRRDPSMGSKVIGWFTQPTVRDVTLRRLLLLLRASPAGLAALGRLIPGRSRRQLWFGFVARYTFWLGVRNGMTRREWARATRGTPVLMYHAFGDTGERHRLIVERRAFARQMRALRLLRFRVIAYRDLADRLRNSQPLPSRTVAITIDDGYRDIAEFAQPILFRYGFPSTVFLVSGRLGAANTWDEDEAMSGRPLLEADEIARLQTEGVQFGAHTRTHCSLPDASDETVDEEIAGSRTDLQQALRQPVTTLAFPYGRFDERALETAQKAGFLSACTVEPRPVHDGDDPYLVPRIEIQGSDSIWCFLRKLWFGGA